MKICILPNMDGILYRIQHLINTLSINNSVTLINDIGDIHNYDIAFIDYFSCKTHNPHLEMCNRINAFKNDLLMFKGKLLFYSLDDGQAIYSNLLDEEIVTKLDGWISYMINDGFLKSCPKYDHILRDKFILIPRYSLPYINTEDVNYETKQNKIVFIGRTTGNYWFENNKNWRIESLKLIHENQTLNENFDGWLVDDEIIDVNKQSLEYNKTFKLIKKDKYLSEEQWIHKLKSNTLSLCIPGHTKLGYRHMQSMACKSTMVGNFDLEYDPYKYLFSDKFKNISYTVKEDLTDFVNICEEAILNKEKTKQYAFEAFDVYKTYFELTPENTYRRHVWKIVTDQFGQLNINFNI